MFSDFFLNKKTIITVIKIVIKSDIGKTFPSLTPHLNISHIY